MDERNNNGIINDNIPNIDGEFRTYDAKPNKVISVESDVNKHDLFEKDNNPNDTAKHDADNDNVTYSSPYYYNDRIGHAPNNEQFNPYVPHSPYPAPQKAAASMPDIVIPKKKKKSRKPLFAVIAICASLIISGGSFYAGVRYVDINTSPATAAYVQTNDTKTNSTVISNANTVSSTDSGEEVTNTITEVVENAMPSMVAINTIIEQTMDDYGYFGFFFGGGYGGQTYESSASGSGIIIGQNENELLIVTNYHVIEDAKEIAIEFIDGESYTAEIKGTASENDLAVVSVQLSDISADTLSKIKVATLGDSTTLKLGEPAIAIGNSLGYGQSVTVGYISATERSVQISDRTMTLIQTDAAINPGNSGGALLNIKGEVIGINSAKLSDTSVEGTGYAIPISDAAPIINDLMSSTHVSDEEKPYLGIYGSSVPETYQVRFGWPAGAYISRVLADSPAELAGLQSGDIITAIDSDEVTGMEDLETILSEHKVGDKIEITIARTDSKGNVKTGTVTATLIAKSESDSMTVG